MRPINIDRETRVPHEHLRSPIDLIEELTLENGAWHPGAVKEGKSTMPRYFALAREDSASEEISVPRAFDISRHLKAGVAGKVPVYAESLERAWWPEVWLGDGDPKLGPHEHMPYDQGPAWRAISAPPEWPWGRILALKCGAGKTVLSLKLARLRGVRTLVVCHTLNMCRTWSETAAADWCLRYPEEYHGFIGDGQIDWEGRDLVFSSMPGLLCRKYPEEFWARWGLVIFDEGDLLGASHLQKMLPLFLGERLLVTATISRRDGNDSLYRFHIGPVCFTDVEQDLQPECIVLDSPVPRMIEGVDRKTGRKTMVSAEQMVWNAYLGRLAPHIPRTITYLTDNFRERQEWAMRVVKSQLNEGRKVLFLGERVVQLQLYNARATEMWGEYKTGLVLGASHMELEECEKNLKECNIIWAIQQIAKRGLNQPDIDTIIVEWASFKDEGRWQQTVGRCLRHFDGKKNPRAILLNDANVPCLNRNAEAAVEYFRLKGYETGWFESEETA